MQRFGSELNKFNADIGKASSHLQEIGPRLQVAGAYTQKSDRALQESGMYYQRAVAELQAITGAVSAPPQQQKSQRQEQGAAT